MIPGTRCIEGNTAGFLFFVCAVKQFNVIIRFNSFIDKLLLQDGNISTISVIVFFFR